jgi:hypothetical protein
MNEWMYYVIAVVVWYVVGCVMLGTLSAGLGREEVNKRFVLMAYAWPVSAPTWGVLFLGAVILRHAGSWGVEIGTYLRQFVVPVDGEGEQNVHRI